MQSSRLKSISVSSSQMKRYFSRCRFSSGFLDGHVLAVFRFFFCQATPGASFNCLLKNRGTLIIFCSTEWILLFASKTSLFGHSSISTSILSANLAIISSIKTSPFFISNRRYLEVQTLECLGDVRVGVSECWAGWRSSCDWWSSQPTKSNISQCHGLFVWFRYASLTPSSCSWSQVLLLDHQFAFWWP